MTESRPPFPPFTLETAIQKVQAAEDAWNTRDPERVSLAYTEDSQWRNRDEHIVGRDADRRVPHPEVAARTRLCAAQEPVGLPENRMAVRFQYECHDAAGQWYRSYGNELWEFTEQGLMARREASINDVKIDATGGGAVGTASTSLPTWSRDGGRS